MAKTLVAVFSASGVTKRVGEKIAQVAGADFYEIVPKEKYTGADLNYMNNRSRSSDTALHKNVSGNVKWAKGVQINRPDEAAIRRMLEKAL